MRENCAVLDIRSVHLKLLPTPQFQFVPQFCAVIGHSLWTRLSLRSTMLHVDKYEFDTDHSEQREEDFSAQLIDSCTSAFITLKYVSSMLANTFNMRCYVCTSSIWDRNTWHGWVLLSCESSVDVTSHMHFTASFDSSIRFLQRWGYIKESSSMVICSAVHLSVIGW